MEEGKKEKNLGAAGYRAGAGRGQGRWLTLKAMWGHTAHRIELALHHLLQKLGHVLPWAQASCARSLPAALAEPGRLPVTRLLKQL